MNHRRFWFDFVFTILGGAIFLFIALPFLSIILKSSPETLLDAFSDPSTMRAIGLSIYSATITTFLGILGGIPLAFLLARRKFPGRGFVESLINLPLVVPHTAAGIALLLVFGRNGLLGPFFQSLGIVFTDHIAGIVVAMLFVSLPLLVSSSREVFSMVDTSLEQAAMVDGAGQWRTFWYVTIPLTWRGILTGALLMWARGISEFGAVVILSYHPMVAPVLVYERFTGFGLSAALPVAILLIFGSVLIFTLLRGSLTESE
jgi:molybdate/tungstate transport system permease protein